VRAAENCRHENVTLTYLSQQGISRRELRAFLQSPESNALFQQISKSMGCAGCLTICCAIVRYHGSSIRKGLFRMGEGNGGEEQRGPGAG